MSKALDTENIVTDTPHLESDIGGEVQPNSASTPNREGCLRGIRIGCIGLVLSSCLFLGYIREFGLPRFIAEAGKAGAGAVLSRACYQQVYEGHHQLEEGSYRSTISSIFKAVTGDCASDVETKPIQEPLETLNKEVSETDYTKSFQYKSSEGELLVDLTDYKSIEFVGLSDQIPEEYLDPKYNIQFLGNSTDIVSPTEDIDLYEAPLDLRRLAPQTTFLQFDEATNSFQYTLQPQAGDIRGLWPMDTKRLLNGEFSLSAYNPYNTTDRPMSDFEAIIRENISLVSIVLPSEHGLRVLRINSKIFTSPDSGKLLGAILKREGIALPDFIFIPDIFLDRKVSQQIQVDSFRSNITSQSRMIAVSRTRP